jgi:hypothetical protein
MGWVHQGFDQTVRVLESRVKIGSNHTYTAVKGSDTSVGKLHENNTGCEFIEKMIADVSKLKYRSTLCTCVSE